MAVKAGVDAEQRDCNENPVHCRAEQKKELCIGDFANLSKQPAVVRLIDPRFSRRLFTSLRLIQRAPD